MYSDAFSVYNSFVKMWWVIVFVLVSLKLQDNNIQAASVLFKTAYNCPNAPNPMPITLDVSLLKTFSNHTQLLDVTLDVPFANDRNTLANAKIEYNTFGNTWMTVANLEGKKGMCNFFTVSGGEMWPELLKSVGLSPKNCPPQGRHHTNHYVLNLTPRKIPGTPPGSYRLTIEVREKGNNRVLLCKMFNIEDKS